MGVMDGSGSLLMKRTELIVRIGMTCYIAVLFGFTHSGWLALHTPSLIMRYSYLSTRDGGEKEGNMAFMVKRADILHQTL
jgi:hypothetical protein